MLCCWESLACQESEGGTHSHFRCHQEGYSWLQFSVTIVTLLQLLHCYSCYRSYNSWRTCYSAMEKRLWYKQQSIYETLPFPLLHNFKESWGMGQAASRIPAAEQWWGSAFLFLLPRVWSLTWVLLSLLLQICYSWQSYTATCLGSPAPWTKL